MSNLCVALPGARAGRRLQERLARMLGPTWSPPRIVTSGKLTDEVLLPGGRAAERIVRTLAWERALRGLDEASLLALVSRRPVPEDESSWTRLAEEARELFGLLAAEGLDFDHVVGCATLPDEGRARFQALARARQSMVEALAESGLVDPHLSRMSALERGAVRAEIDLVLGGVVEMNALARRTCELLGSRATVLVVAPEREAASFDELGCLEIARWKDRDVPLPIERWSVVRGPEDQARESLSILAGWNDRFAAEEISIGVADPEVTPYLVRRLREQGVEPRDSAGTSIERSSPMMLLAAIASFTASLDFRSYATLARHPDFEAALRAQPALRSCEPAAWLDAYLAEHLPARVDGTWLGERSALLRRLHDGILELLGDLAAADSRPLHAWTAPIRALLGRVYGGRALDDGVESDRVLTESLRAIGATLAVIESALGSLSPETSAAHALHRILRSLHGERIGPAPPRTGERSIELLGWLELPLDDARALVVTGFDEGYVPALTRSDPWLPESMRRALALEDEDRRVARDVWAATLCCKTRAEFAFVSGRRSGTGDPLQPSRLAFHVPNDDVPARMRHALEPRGSPRPGEASPARPRRLPLGEAREPLRRFPVTSFRRYLESPYLFYLECVLGLETFEHDGHEIDPPAFGVLAHAVLQTLGRDELRAEQDERRIDAALQDELATLARERFGPRPLPAVELQIAQLAWRLSRFAERQAERARAGWHIAHVEWKPSRPVTLDVGDETIELTGRIDRIDVNEAEGRWAILDYKSGEGKSSESPESAHRKRDGTWKDLQLPLYVHLAAELCLPGIPELGYGSIGREPAAIGFDTVRWDRELIEQALEAARAVARCVLDGEFLELGSARPRADVFAALCGQGLLMQAEPGEGA